MTYDENFDENCDDNYNHNYDDISDEKKLFSHTKKKISPKLCFHQKKYFHKRKIKSKHKETRKAFKKISFCQQIFFHFFLT